MEQICSRKMAKNTDQELLIKNNDIDDDNIGDDQITKSTKKHLKQFVKRKFE